MKNSLPPRRTRGSAVPDVDAVGPEQQSQSDWRSQNNIDVSKQIKLVRVSHMRYQHPDLDEITTFLQGWDARYAQTQSAWLTVGFPRFWHECCQANRYRGMVLRIRARSVCLCVELLTPKTEERSEEEVLTVYATDYAKKGPKKFLGGAYLVESYQDLERAIALDSNAEIKEMPEAPGKGYMVAVTDPEGFPVNLVYEQEVLGDSHEKPPAKIITNYEEEKPRLRKFLRFEPGPAGVYKVSSPTPVR